jgi:dihydroorotase (multifunctional complex type)
MTEFDLRLSGGQSLLPGLGLSAVDILVKDGRIAGFCQPQGQVKVKEEVAIPGLTVLPGAIDGHVHLSQNLTYPKSAEDVTTESVSAAAGGVTTFLVYLMTPEPYDQVFHQVVKLMEASSTIDFGLHFCICTEDQKDAVPSYAKDLGVSSYKLFMNFKADEGKYLGIPGNDDGFLYRLLQAGAGSGGMLCPHAENIELIRAVKDEAMALEKPPLAKWNASRPPFAEAEALSRAAYLAKVAGSSFYAVHVTSAESLQVVASAKADRANVFIETCPQYLTHNLDSDLAELGKVNPPLRTADDCKALWGAIGSGLIDTVGSDHVPRVKAAKSGDIWKAAAGFPGVQTLMPILVSEGHIKRGLPIERVVDLVSANPARIFGLGDRKGRVAVGYDADLAIVDLNARYTLEAGDLYSVAGYSIYEGWEVACRPVHTLVRGEFVLRDGRIQPLAGHGNYCPRPISGASTEDI